jgi:hypothetical protein
LGEDVFSASFAEPPGCIGNIITDDKIIMFIDDSCLSFCLSFAEKQKTRMKLFSVHAGSGELEARVRIELTIQLLQSRALPLGDRAVF